MTIDLSTKKLSDMTDAELQELKNSINEIELQRLKELMPKLNALVAELSQKG